MTVWTDLGTRARGLGTRLLPDAILDELDGARTTAAVASALAGAGWPVAAGRGTWPDPVERAVADVLASDRAIVHRWAGARARHLAAILDDADVISLRALVRGAVAGVAAERRLAATVPTPTLPVAVLTALAGAADAAALIAVLVGRGHPYADALAAAGAASRDARVDLIEVELALVRRLVERARAGLARGGRALAAYLTQVVDAANLVAAVTIAARGPDLDPDRCWLDGGARLDRATYRAAATAEPDQARARLAVAFAATPLAAAVTAPAPAAIADAVLAWQLATQTDLRRREPHGLAPVLWFHLRRRAEARRVRRAAWRVALELPS